MGTGSIVLIILLIGFVVCIVILVTRKKAEAKKSDSLGKQLLKAAEEIPVYGQVAKVIGKVGKPINQALNKLNKGITTGLQHVPVVGKYLAMPNQIAGSAVKKVTSFFGL